jgi:hypothetical protein
MRPEQSAQTTRPHCLQWCFRSPLQQHPNVLPHESIEHRSASLSGCHRRRGTCRAPLTSAWLIHPAANGGDDEFVGNEHAAENSGRSVRSARASGLAKASAGGEWLVMMPTQSSPLAPPRHDPARSPHSLWDSVWRELCGPRAGCPRARGRPPSARTPPLVDSTPGPSPGSCGPCLRPKGPTPGPQASTPSSLSPLNFPDDDRRRDCMGS